MGKLISSVISSGKLRKKPSAATILMVFCTLVLIVLIVFPSYMLLLGSLGGEWLALTPEYYVEALTSPYYLGITGTTFFIASMATILATIVGVTFAWIMTRTNTPLKSVFETLFLFPIFISPLIGAVTWIVINAMLTFVLQNVLQLQLTTNVRSVWGIVWVMALYYTPTVFLFTSAALKSMDPALEEASLVSGVGTLGTALRITLNVISPSILSAALLIFLTALHTFSIPAVLGRSSGIYVYSTAIYNLLAFYPQRYSSAAALSGLLLIFTAVGVYAQRRVRGRRKFVTVTGKGLRPHTIDIGRWRYVALAMCLGYITLSVFLPMFAMLLSSFMRYLTFENPTFTLSNYAFVLFSHPQFGRAIRNSFFLATVGGILCILLTAIVSFVVIRTRTRGREILDYISMIPSAFPGSALAVAFLWAWISVPLPIYGTIWILLIGYITFYIPYGIRASSSSLLQISPEFEEASRTCGVSWLRTMRRITLPLLKPGLLAAWTILFAHLLREVDCSAFLYSYGSEVLSVVLYDVYFEGQYCLAAAMAVIQTAIVFVALWIVRKAVGIELSKVVY